MRKYISDSCKVYQCNSCGCHLAKESDLISTSFQGHSGPAYLFSSAYNIIVDQLEEERGMTTGKHRIKIIECSGCHKIIGWKYLQAFTADQRYKEGKCVIERYYISPIDNSAVKIPNHLQNCDNLITKLNYYHQKM